MRITWILVFLLLFSSDLYAIQVPQDVAVRILIGEAGNQGEKGMICVAEVLRRRESYKGFYIYDLERYRKLPRSVRERAARAWTKSSTTNFTSGADHFFNVHSFKKPYWVSYCVKTYEYRDHVFYKEVKKK
jgi:hypothetical protein